MKKTDIRVLLVEDDEDDYVIFQDLLSEIKYFHIELTWVDNYKATLETARDDVYDIYILDYFLRGATGIDLLNDFRLKGLRNPVIILTGQGDHDVDVQAMQKGASDYLEKDKITPQLLEKAIRYAISQSQTMEDLRESEKQLRVLSSKLIDAQEDERKRIAKELHDGIGSNLAAVKFEIQKQMDGLKNNISDIQHGRLKNLVDMVQDTIDETRRIYTNLRPTVLDDLGILMAIRWFCRNFQQIYSNILIQTDLNIQEEEISDPLKIVIYRVMQEALNNVAKHSGADKVNLIFEKSEGTINLTIRDNGHGFDVHANKKVSGRSGGMGLISMKERVGYSGGKLFIRSDVKSGTEVKAIWPML